MACSCTKKLLDKLLGSSDKQLNLTAIKWAYSADFLRGTHPSGSREVGTPFRRPSHTDRALSTEAALHQRRADGGTQHTNRKCILPMWYFYLFIFMLCTLMFCLMYAWVRVPGPLELKLERAMRHLVGAENWTQVFWKSSQCYNHWVISPALSIW